MTCAESIARCRWAARPYLMARWWLHGTPTLAGIAAWYGVTVDDVAIAIRTHTRRRR